MIAGFKGAAMFAATYCVMQAIISALNSRAEAVGNTGNPQVDAANTAIEGGEGLRALGIQHLKMAPLRSRMRLSWTVNNLWKGRKLDF